MAREVVDLVESDLGALQLLEDGVVALDAPLYARLDVVFAKLLDERVFNAAEKLLSLDALGFNGFRDFLEADGVGVAEGKIFKFAAHLAHAETMGERGVDVESLASDGFAAVGLQVLQRTHIVQAVGQLDENHANVGDHGEQHFSHVFGLAVFAVGELDLVDLGDAFDNVRHLIAEVGFDLLRWWRGCLRRRRGGGRRLWPWSPSSSRPELQQLQGDE